MAKKEIVIIGIGRFATELINNLNNSSNYSIVAIDKNPKKLEQLIGVKNIIVGDATDKEFLLNIGVENADSYIIGMGQDFQASLVITSIIKENFHGKIFAKSVNEDHENILKSLGVEEVVTPEVAAAKIVYRKIINPLSLIKGGELYQMTEFIPGISIVNVPVLKNDFGKTIKELKIPDGIGIALIIKEATGPKTVNGMTLIEEGDVLSIIGPENLLLKLLSKISNNKSKETEEELE